MLPVKSEDTDQEANTVSKGDDSYPVNTYRVTNAYYQSILIA